VARVLCGMYINCACCTWVNFNQGETRKIIYVCSKSCSRIIHVRYHMFIKKCATMYILKKRFFRCGTMVYIEIGSLMYIQTYIYSLKLKKLEDDRVQH